MWTLLSIDYKLYEDLLETVEVLSYSNAKLDIWPDEHQNLKF